VTAVALTRSRARYATATGSPARARGVRSAGPPSPGRAGTRYPGRATPPGANPGGGQPARDGQDNGNQNNGPAPDPANRAERDAEVEKMAAQLADRTADLQRLQAEYANYRKRVERDRMAVREQALANVLTELLPALDDIGRAREHGELVGGFKSVAESLEAATVKLGLNSYGEDGDPFDPNLHDALMHSYSPDVTETTCVRILQPGYKVGDRILRPARVAVAEPGEPDEDEGGGDDASTYHPADTSGGD
jgi:molecular chaperone GrpE